MCQMDSQPVRRLKFGRLAFKQASADYYKFRFESAYHYHYIHFFRRQEIVNVCTQNYRYSGYHSFIGLINTIKVAWFYRDAVILVWIPRGADISYGLSDLGNQTTRSCLSSTYIPIMVVFMHFRQIRRLYNVVKMRFLNKDLY